MAVYISSSVLKGLSIKEALDRFLLSNLEGIEWSGGHLKSNIKKNDLISLLQNSKLPCRLHNYFPPPTKDFVLNLASNNTDIVNLSIKHIKRAIDISSRIGAKVYGIHAGFFFDPSEKKLGKKISFTKLWSRSECIDRFCSHFLPLQDYAKMNGVKLYIENNVLSKENAISFSDSKPMMLLDFEDWIELALLGVNNLLLDISHLFVTANSLGLDYEYQVREMFQSSDYIHISHNDGNADTNRPVIYWGNQLVPLKNITWKNKNITVEVYTSLDDCIKSVNFIENNLI
ncbi:TIM barrel protein [Marispirochaeta aestuarii]|uniref:sugar phosphate isomerase/epimerase family protein n=1 Tax=Marispirochaeta aestuarii TaxID=1963862 RepID=UPI002ABD33ED|nr:TIM barrel protein [Marispirochaeta aestuarii]